MYEDVSVSGMGTSLGRPEHPREIMHKNLRSMAIVRRKTIVSDIFPNLGPHR
jgi:hypothetical protein